MRLTFQLRFHTHPGQSLLLSGNHEIFGNGNPERALPLLYRDNESWQVTLLLPAHTAPQADIRYHYILREADGSLVEDWGGGRSIHPSSFDAEEVVIIDSWNSPGFIENAFYTEPFLHVLLRGRRSEAPVFRPDRVTHTLRVKSPLLEKGQTLCLLGSAAQLGGWGTEKPILLNRAEGADDFAAELDLSAAPFPFEYKYGVYDLVQARFLRYEGGSNRTLREPCSPEKKVIVNDGFAVLPATTWKGAGVAIPVFSLRSEDSFGIGEFKDLERLADWCHLVGIKLIQILPINDTIATHTWLDSYPYAAISAFALHPVYLNLADLTSRANEPLLRSLEPKRIELNQLEAVDYPAVLRTKLEFIRRIYPSQCKSTFRSREFKTFFEQNKDWLVPYACYSFLRERHGTPEFARWPTHQVFDPSEIARLSAPESSAYDEIAIHYFIQYHLHRQLKQATDYAHSKGVVLKGDIAIGVHRQGADAWQHPELFHMNLQAGAPPDAFGIKGQNWSFPTYNWPRMQQDGFAWWRRRFEQMGRYFDAFRIDHILGFFRIWSIPCSAVEGILGYFVPALPVRLEEFRERGLPADVNRYTEPWITEEALGRQFGPEAPSVKERFLAKDSRGNYRLKAEFATQRQVEEVFADHETEKTSAQLKETLFDWISDLILLRPEDSMPGQFHFRFGMENTSSFKALDPAAQAKLRDLYIDYFYRRQDEFWRREGLKKLPALKRATDMLVCGEDLGMVPACVPQVMQQLGLLSLEVQRMPKRLDQEFFRPANAPYLSVITPSTHDMSTIRGWWQEERSVIQKFYSQELGGTGTAPESCEPWISQRIIRQHLESPAMWSIFQLQDLLGMDEHLRRPNPQDERINVPANPRNYWCYRMHLTLEQLMRSNRFSESLREMLRTTDRCPT